MIILIRDKISKELGVYMDGKVWVVPLLILGVVGVKLIFFNNIVELNVTNITPYNVSFKLYYQESKNINTTTGWYKLSPGESFVLKHRFPYNVDRVFYIHNRSSKDDKAKVLWLYEDQPDLIGEKAELTLNTRLPSSSYFDPAEYEDLGFSKIAVDTPEEREWHYFINDPTFDVFPRVHQSGFQAFVDQTKNRVVSLSDAIDRQMYFEKEWHGYITQFSIGAETIDENGHLSPGVTLKEILKKTIFGVDMPYHEGDILISFNGVKIYSPWDLYILLHKHATSYSFGIKKQYKFEIFRSGKILAGETTFFFNPEYYGYSQKDRDRAAAFGLLSGITLDFDSEAKAYGTNIIIGINNLLADIDGTNIKKRKYVDTEEVIWKEDQEKARLSQMYSDSFEGGAMLSLLAPVGASRLVARGVSARVARRVGNKALARGLTYGILEAAEVSVWTIKSSPPGSSSKQIIDDLKEIAPLAVAIGFGTGLTFGK